MQKLIIGSRRSEFNSLSRFANVVRPQIISRYGAGEAPGIRGKFDAETYHERSPTGWRKFTLQEDRLIVVGKKRWRAEFKLPILLRHIDPVYGVMRRRGDLSGPGAILLG